MSCRTENQDEKLLTRLNKIEGQIKGIKTMVKEGRDCMDIIHQISSATSALRGVWQIMAAEHLTICLNNMDNSEQVKVINDIVESLQKLK